MTKHLKRVNERASEKCLVCEGHQTLIFTYKDYSYYRCGSCGLVSTFPIPSPGAIENHYAKKFQQGNYKLARVFAERLKQGPYADFLRVLSERLTAKGETLPGKKVLDIGCFTGEFLELLDDQGAVVYGLELQREAVEIANGKFPGRIFQADVFGDEFPTQQFDIVTALAVIEHVTLPMKLLSRVYELLRPGGTIFLQTPNSGSAFAKVLGKYWPPYAPVEHINLFSKTSLETALLKSGFSDISYIPHWKKLPIEYVYDQFQNFGPEFHRILAPLYRILPGFIKAASFPFFYVGEMMMVGTKSDRHIRGNGKRRSATV
jgi:SAM-dependent methyltransferase